MASGNSQEIITYKQSAMTTVASVENIVKAINAKYPIGDNMDPGDLFYTHIFPYAYIPETIETAGCYITFEVSMPSVSTANYFFKDVLITITVICHQDVMQMTENEPLGVTGATRADYISVELDKLFNKSTKLIGQYELELVSNIEGAIDPVHRCRVMRFKTQAPVQQPCKR